MHREGSFHRRKRRWKLEESKLEAKAEGRTTVQIRKEFLQERSRRELQLRIILGVAYPERIRQTERKPISQKWDPTRFKSFQICEDA